jgi:hypothetical protein
MIVIRGINVFPSEIEAVLLDSHRVSGQYQIIIDRRPVLPEIVVRAELAKPVDPTLRAELPTAGSDTWGAPPAAGRSPAGRSGSVSPGDRKAKRGLGGDFRRRSAGSSAPRLEMSDSTAVLEAVDRVTDGGRRELRCAQLVYEVADRVRVLPPKSRSQTSARICKGQAAPGDQTGRVLLTRFVGFASRPSSSRHGPARRESLERIDDFRRSGVADLGSVGRLSGGSEPAG